MIKQKHIETLSQPHNYMLEEWKDFEKEMIDTVAELKLVDGLIN